MATSTTSKVTCVFGGIFLLCQITLFSCADNNENTTQTQVQRPKPIEDGTGLNTVEDQDSAENSIEINLEAAEGEYSYGDSLTTKVWQYNSTIPGPLIDAKVGDTIKINFTNNLPDPTTIHWHGVRLPAAMDGAPMMQDPIKPGETFTYKYTFKDAGLYWYHPHIQTDIQLQRGLYGAIRVRGENEPTVDDERVIILDDVRLKADGSLSEYLDDTALMMGREGNTILVNGLVTPTLKFLPGALVRFRLVNAANGRFFNLSLKDQTWRVIGTDGGLIQSPYDTNTLLIAPGERYDVLVRMPTTEGSVELTGLPHDRGHDSGDADPFTVATVSIEGKEVTPALDMPEEGPAMTPLAEDGPVDFTLRLNEALGPEGTVFTVNDEVYPNVPMMHFDQGSLKIYELKNESEMDHPFHIHGFFFQILEQNGKKVPTNELVKKDTIIVPMKSSLKLVTLFDEPGMWMYHCHILEHAEHGMVGEIEVK